MNAGFAKTSSDPFSALPNDGDRRMKILICNPGSTSLKYKLFEFEQASDPAPRTLAQGKIERIGNAESPFAFTVGEGTAARVHSGSLEKADYRGALQAILEFLIGPESGAALASIRDLSAVGFKAVHAGPQGRGPGATRLTKNVIDAMERYLLLAPAHNGPYLTAIRVFQEIAPDVPLAALFEPAFHATIPEERVTYGLPLEWRERWGVRRYGFHGASHHYIAERIPQLMRLTGDQSADLRLISCHLGGSSSLCAVKGGKSVDTTFGFSAQTGILHSTRCETVDAFVALFAQKEMGLMPEEVSRVLCKESGLKGLSGGSGDFRDLWAQVESGDREAARRAELALEVFFYQVRREVAAMAAALEGVDAIAFTGGIGENGIRERAAICLGLRWLGVELDASANQRARGIETRISAEGAPVAVWTCPTNEELIVAREILRLLGREPST